MNTREDLERIAKHCKDIPEFHATPLLVWVNQIANKLDYYQNLVADYQKLVDEKDLIIKKMIERGE